MKSISLHGIKSFLTKQKVQLADLTILAGANSSGKSTAAQSFLLVKQTVEAQFDPGAMLLDGPNVKLATMSNVVSKRPGYFPASDFSLGFELSDGVLIESTFAASRSDGADITVTKLELSDGHKIELRSNQELSETDGRALTESLPEGIAKLATGANGHWVARPGRGFNDAAMTIPISSDPLKPETFELARLPIQQAVRMHCSKLIHIQGLRGNPERVYAANAKVSDQFPGLFTDYVASIITQWQEEQNPKLDAVGNDLRELGLSWKVRTKRIHATQVELQVSRLPAAVQGGAHDLVNIADVGIGVSQVLPLLVALHVAKPGQIVFVEQPEIHLHPRAQFRLAEVLVRACNRGVRVWVETHSSVMLRGIQTLVAKNELDPFRVALNWFSRDPSTGGTFVTRGQLNENGQFGNWPSDFDEASMEIDKAYLDAVAANLFSSN